MNEISYQVNLSQLKDHITKEVFEGILSMDIFDKTKEEHGWLYEFVNFNNDIDVDISFGKNYHCIDVCKNQETVFHARYSKKKDKFYCLSQSEDFTDRQIFGIIDTVGTELKNKLVNLELMEDRSPSRSWKW